ncbi:hypothetical protein [Longibaculum muris]|uniref:hypothetical protein n=1 Tax=Longibaculum muris TaxID=1796628 RepID=UPI0022E823EC|nr:hypothetical protein [Longibaculum muris]
MKKSTILSLATAIAVVGTSAFTFAVWDETTASKTATLSVGSPVKITADTFENFKEDSSRTLGNNPVYTSDVTFNISGNDTGKATSLTLTPTVKENDVTLSADKVDVTLEQTGDDTGLLDLVDSKIEASNTYTVKVTVKDAGLAAKDLTVEVTGELK